MTDLISRAEAIKAICEDGTKLEREGRYILLTASRKQRDADILSALPTVDAVPVVHGRWTDKDGGIATCSVCGDRWGVWSVMKYCPSCGAKMDGKDGDHHEG